MFQKVKLIKRNIFDIMRSERNKSSLFIDDKEITGFTNVVYDFDVDGLPIVTITMHAEFECVSENGDE